MSRKKLNLETFFAENFSAVYAQIYKTWEWRCYGEIAEAAAKKKTYCYLPVEMFVAAVEHNEEIKNDHCLFELLTYSGCKDYKLNILAHSESIIKACTVFKLEESQLFDLRRIINELLLPSKEFELVSQIISVVINKNELKKAIEIFSEALGWYLQDLCRNITPKTLSDIEKVLDISADLEKSYRQGVLVRATQEARKALYEYELFTKLEEIVSRIFPGQFFKWPQQRIYSENYIFDIIAVYSTPMADYTNDNYAKVIDLLIKYLKAKGLEGSMRLLTEKLLVALANKCIRLHSDIRQDKKAFLFFLFKTNSLFKKVVKDYFYACPKLMAELIMHYIDERETNSFSELIALYDNSKMSENDYNEITYELALSSDHLSLSKHRDCETYYYYYQNMLRQLTSVFPKLDMQQITVVSSLREIEQDLVDLQRWIPYCGAIKEGKCWLIDSMPQQLNFQFSYPDGARGDLIMNLAKEYGELSQTDTLTWRVQFDKNDIEKIDILLYERDFTQYFTGCQMTYLPFALRNSRNGLRSSHTRNFELYKTVDSILEDAHNKLIQKRNRYFSKLIIEDKISPKWKSEAQLFVLVSDVFPDAVYQYHASWLRMQSLDIYIPCINTAIEYQGVQHYEPVDYFGGVEQFKHRQALDIKKKNLCKANKVKLIEWPYTKEISKDNVLALVKNISRLKSV